MSSDRADNEINDILDYSIADKHEDHLFFLHLITLIKKKLLL
jgi:hypothetical protein